MTRCELLRKLQSYKFAAYDMLLYLDTHPKDKTAFKMYKDLVAMVKKLTMEFEEKYGPLTVKSAADFETFRWTESPWPWEKEANS